MRTNHLASRTAVKRFFAALTAGVALLALAPRDAAAGAALDKLKQAGKLVYCSDLSAPPFLYLDQKTLKPAGFDIDIGSAVAKAMGVTAEYKNITFDGLIPALQAGQCDAIISSLFDKPKRREVVDFVDYAEVGSAVIAKASAGWSVKALTDLSGKKIAAERGSVNEEELNTASAELTKAGKPPISVVALPKVTDAIQMVLSGTADAFYTGTETQVAYEKEHPGVLKLASPQTSAFLTGIATVKASGDIHEAIDAGFKKMIADGTYAGIVKTWGFESMAIKP